MYIMILKWTCAIFFSPVICNFKVDRVGFLKLFIGDVVQIYEEGDGMYICNRYQIILSILWPLNMLVYLIKIPYNIIIKYVIKINNMYDLWEFYPWLNTYIEIKFIYHVCIMYDL